MYFFNPPLVDYAVEYFRHTDFADPAEGDKFWGVFAPGNSAHITDRPFERLSDYEEMLGRLRDADDGKYEQMHKGTPFYIMSWLAFDLRNYKKALFYIDAAVSEDIRNTENTPDPDSWKRLPGADFLRLRPDQMVARRAITRVRAVLSEELGRFNGISQRQAVDIDVIVRFVQGFIDASQRTIISALYIFIMESRERLQELALRRGSRGGSNEPFTVHLFTGGLLFESLLKHFYPQSATGKHWVLNDVLTNRDFRQELNVAAIQGTSASTLREIYDAIQASNSAETAFSTAAKLRNTTGHNLIWDDVFSSPEIYRALFHQVMNAVLYVVDAKGR